MRLGAAVSHAINIFSLLHLNCCIWITRWFLCDLKSPPGKPAECHPSAQQAALPALQPSTLPPCHPFCAFFAPSFGASFFNYLLFCCALFIQLLVQIANRQQKTTKKKQAASKKVRGIRCADKCRNLYDIPQFRHFAVELNN